MFAVFYGSSKVFDGTHAECSRYVRLAAVSEAINWWIGEQTSAGWVIVEYER